MIKHKFLVVIETQRVKEYLFSSPILRETRGASLLLDELNRKDCREILNTLKDEEFRTIYLGGGSGRVLFESRSKAKAFAEKVQRIYRQKTINARVSVEVVERADNESVPGWMRRGVAESQKNKLGRTEAMPLLGGRWFRPCSSCGQTVAEVDKSIIYYEDGLESEPTEINRLCASCYNKRNSAHEFYRYIKRNKGRHDPVSRAKLRRTHPDYVLTTLVNRMKSYNILLPQDFDQIGEQSKPQNYIGFIYADGNRMGEVIKSMADKKKYPEEDDALNAYQAFSKIVDVSTRQAAAQAVQECVGSIEEDTRKNRRGLFVPAEFVLAGGDDLILIVPAQYALDVATRFITLFNKETMARQATLKAKGELRVPFESGGLTTSAGVVIAHASYPCSQLMDLAADLMKLAKRKAAGLARNGNPQGTLDFMILHSAGSEPIKRRRKREYVRTLPSGLKVELTERPYTADDMGKLLRLIRDLKQSGVPRNKLKRLYPILFQDILPAQFDAQRIRERLEKTGAFNLKSPNEKKKIVEDKEEVEKAGDVDPNSPLRQLVNDLGCFPFRVQGPNLWTTPLTEIIELYDYIQVDEPQVENQDG